MPTVSLKTDSNSLGRLFTGGGRVLRARCPDVRPAELYRDRFSRTLEIGKEFRFFASPCQQAPVDELGAGFPGLQPVPGGAAASGAAAGLRAGPVRPGGEPAARQPDGQTPPSASGAGRAAQNAVDVLRRLAAERAELPLEAVSATATRWTSCT